METEEKQLMGLPVRPQEWVLVSPLHLARA